MTCIVGFRSQSGARYWMTTAGETLFTACAAALDFFDRPFWKGPRPSPATVLEVHLVGSPGVYRVRAERIRRWRRACEWAWILSLFRKAGVSVT